jgi:energy-coupling factor transporter ATP-binding protein EcfA2
MMKVVYESDLDRAVPMSEAVTLPLNLVNLLLEEAVDRELLEILGSESIGSLAGLRYALTSRGRQWAVEAMMQSSYVGPAPVTFDDFAAQVGKQKITGERISGDQIKEVTRHLVLEDGLLEQLGPAVNSGQAILLYGPSGNGKTSVAEAIGEVFHDTIFVPHCVEVAGQIIKIFDETVHEPVPVPDVGGIEMRSEAFRSAEFDRRWVPCKRPVIMTGGELTLELLDLTYTDAKFYEAPLQLKAANGIFIIDDFGRQQVSPKEVLNRWIIPLERRVDYLTLHTGKKFAIPFDELVIFSTNYPPKEMMDAAALRRIPFKIEMRALSDDGYEEIFRNACAARGLAMPDNLIAHLKNEFYGGNGGIYANYHPKFIVDQVIASCKFQGIAPVINKETILGALKNLETSY